MKNIKLVIVGSIGIDSIETPYAKEKNILGGSASYACVAASFFSNIGMIGVIGSDFPNSFKKLWKDMDINLDGLQIQEGKTFRWSGKYEENMDNRETISTELNVFENFQPSIPNSYKNVPYLFLGNIHPKLQLDVLNKMNSPRFVLIDTMDLWINTAKKELEEVISKSNMLTLNESEARLYTNKNDLICAAKELLKIGPDYILIKKGVNGAILYSKDSIFLLHAYPVETCCDPTGAGDSFAGGLMGFLSKYDTINEKTIREAMTYGTITASFGIEEFSLNKFQKINKKDIDNRFSKFLKMFAL
ncbi:MAG: PfkB family carbohydrate kinase [Verrucomicrobiota bacterium]|nr:PfkB family carbohydrate kinase [Verrucomicrobiota bacterium]MEC8753212.1 PfkB family carbohydrate kinase [Verrucomicrobiota bacterium]